MINEEEMPDQLKNYLMEQGKAQGRPMYAQNGVINSMKNAFGTPEAQAAVEDFKKQPTNPYQNFANVASGQKTPEYFYSKKTNRTKIVYPDGKVEIRDGHAGK